jgi:hypothetical protein
MTVFDYQINSVIRTYVKNMKDRMSRFDDGDLSLPDSEHFHVSDEGMKRVLFQRIEEKMTERLRRHDIKG